MRSTALLITGLLIFILAVLNAIFLVIIFRTRRKLDQVSGWPSTNGVVTASSVETRSGGDDNGPSEYPVIRYSYQVGGQAFEGRRITPGPEVGGSGARRVTGRYITGAPVTVFYNPQNPAEAVLEKRAPVQALLWIILGVLDCALCGSIPLAWFALASQ